MHDKFKTKKETLNQSMNTKWKIEHIAYLNLINFIRAINNIITQQKNQINVLKLQRKMRWY